jgi:hypothetical protein
MLMQKYIKIINHKPKNNKIILIILNKKNNYVINFNLKSYDSDWNRTTMAALENLKNRRRCCSDSDSRVVENSPCADQKTEEMKQRTKKQRVHIMKMKKLKKTMTKTVVEEKPTATYRTSAPPNLRVAVRYETPQNSGATGSTPCSL